MNKEKNGCGKLVNQEVFLSGTLKQYCGNLLLCKDCKTIKEFEEVGQANFGSKGK